MDNKGILIIILTVLFVLGIALGTYFLISPNNSGINANSNNNSNSTGSNATDIVNNSSDVKNASLSSSSNTQKHYDDWQKDYETGLYDEDGNPIYRSVMSTSGGQNDPGIYEAYWSANGPINQTRIG